jgi:hypothetical protein
VRLLRHPRDGAAFVEFGAGRVRPSRVERLQVYDPAILACVKYRGTFVNPEGKGSLQIG